MTSEKRDNPPQVENDVKSMQKDTKEEWLDELERELEEIKKKWPGSRSQ